jgi:uncharacterized membrane protein
MLWFGRRKNQKLVDAKRVEAAIAAAERHTSGQIRVSLAPRFWGNVERTADKAFVRLGMTNTRERNGVLFFVVPSRRAFVVLGDRGIHAHVGQAFWDDLAQKLSAHFQRGEFTEGLLAAIAAAAEHLEMHFPRDPNTALNELSNEIDLQG